MPAARTGAGGGRGPRGRVLRLRVGAGLLCLLAGCAPASAQLRGSFSGDAPDRTGILRETPSPGDRTGSIDAPGAAPGYRIRPVDGAPAAAGVRRSLETFRTWTLICDEVKRRRICNASQSIAAPDGSLAFSWSLAATRGGEPVFLVRAPVAGFPARTVTLALGEAETTIRLDACDPALCVGFLPLDAAILRRIADRAGVTIVYRRAEGALPETIATSFDGLQSAIAAIR